MIQPETPRFHTIVLILCAGINVIFFLARHDYMALFIAASLYLNMYYFITLLIPTNFKAAGIPKADLNRFRTWLKEIGVTSGTARFTRLFINSILINSRTLSLGIGLIFSIDILYSLVAYARGLPFMITLIVISQCAVIVVFYLMVWKFEPFSTTYEKHVEKMKSSLHRQNLPPHLVTAMFIFGFLLAIVLFLTTIILLPGVTLNAFLDQSKVAELGHVFFLIALLAFSQYFIIRYIHGITSRTMADRLFDFKENALSDLLNPDASLNTDRCDDLKNRAETTTLLLESRIYTIKRNTLAGTFPVFVVDLDFSVILDSTTLTAIRGYIGDTKIAR
ncbi:MAG: hypothetical protein NTZ37_05685 [Methanoregula sp.]|nr:hypothetical protein [Methanoregula sp.]